MSRLHYAIHLTIVGALLFTGCEPLTSKSVDDPAPVATKGVVVFSFVAMDQESESAATDLTNTLIQSLEKTQGISVLTKSDLPPSMHDSSNHDSWPKNDLVSLILEGSVKETEEGTAVTVQLLDASSDAHVWADTYVSEQGDVTKIVAAVKNKVVLAANR